MFSFETRKDGWRVIGLGVASFLTIFPLCAWRHLEIIESDLLERSTSALEEAGFSGLQIGVSGRDLTLTGLGAGQKTAQAQQILSQVYGVRVVALTGLDNPDSGSD